MNDETIKEITRRTAAQFRSFGGGKTSQWNPIAIALADKPPQFAAGVDIEEVVRFVLCAALVQGGEN